MGRPHVGPEAMSSEAISAPAQQELVSPSEPVHSDHTHDPTEVHHIHDRNSAGDPTKPAIVTGHAADNDDDVTAADVDPAKAIFPHSPPDSNKMTKSEASDSELSDLDDDAIDLGPETHSDPVPDPASGPVADPDIDRQHEDIKTEDDDDIGDIEPADWSGQVPIFRPTMDQFKDFKRFVRPTRLPFLSPPSYLFRLLLFHVHNSEYAHTDMKINL